MDGCYAKCIRCVTSSVVNIIQLIHSHFASDLGIDPKRLTRERLLYELKKRNINVINTAKRDELIRELELALANETETTQNGKKRIL
jgi:hypothetical protein